VAAANAVVDWFGGSQAGWAVDVDCALDGEWVGCVDLAGGWEFFAGGEPESELASGGVADDDDSREIEVVGGGELGEGVGSGADILIRAGPASAGVADTAVFDVPGGDALLSQCAGEWAEKREGGHFLGQPVERSGPAAAVDDDGDGEVSSRGGGDLGNAEFAELERVGAVGDAGSGRRGLGEERVRIRGAGDGEVDGAAEVLAAEAHGEDAEDGESNDGDDRDEDDAEDFLRQRRGLWISKAWGYQIATTWDSTIETQRETGEEEAEAMETKEAIQVRNAKQRFEATDVDMSGSTFTDVSLSGANFYDVNFSGAVIHNGNLSELRAENVNLAGAQILDADLTGVSIAKSAMEGMTIDGILVAELMAAYRDAHRKAN
jgi:hypothetical protein